MASLNKVLLIGNLGKDPELRKTGSGTAVCNFSIATTERWKNNETNNWDEKTEWHNVVVWGKQGENCHQYLSKGRPVYIEGRLQTRSWDDKEGKKRYTTEVVATSVKFLGGRQDASFAGPSAGGEAVAGNAARKLAPAAQTDSPPEFDADEDMPF